MADLTVTPERVRILEVIESRMIPMFADVAVTRGQAVYTAVDGDAAVARANAVGTAKVVGIATLAAGANSAFEALYHGGLTGFDLSAVNPGTTIYLSITTGGLLADAAAVGVGNVVVAIGTVKVLTDVGRTKYIFVDIPQNAVTPTAL